jgi:hypothetical protein
MSPPFADLPLLVSGLVFTPNTPTAGRSRGISRALYDQMCGVWAEKREATTGEEEGGDQVLGPQEATTPKLKPKPEAETHKPNTQTKPDLRPQDRAPTSTRESDEKQTRTTHTT